MMLKNVDIEENQAIDNENMAIKNENIAIEERIGEIKFNIQTKRSIKKLYSEVNTDKIQRNKEKI